MPKINLTERDKDNERLRKNLVLLQGGKNHDEMSKIIGAKAANTYANRLKNPEALTYGEIKRLCKYFRVSIADFTESELKVGVH